MRWPFSDLRNHKTVCLTRLMLQPRVLLFRAEQAFTPDELFMSPRKNLKGVQTFSTNGLEGNLMVTAIG